jgi:hypothetical protein
LKRFSAIYLFLFFTLKLYAQEDIDKKACVLNGIVLSENQHSPIYNVHIINLSAGNGCVSDSSGFFHLLVQVSDSVLFSYMGYARKTICINAHYCDRKLDTILLRNDTLGLAEISIYPFARWQEFKREFVELDIEKTPQREIELQGVSQYKGPYKPPKPSPINNPVSYIYFRYSKRGRIRHKLEKIRSKRQQDVYKD